MARKILIVTGVPLALLSFGFGVWLDGSAAWLWAMGAYVTMRTISLIREPQ